jgi:hypothetical protein
MGLGLIPMNGFNVMIFNKKIHSPKGVIATGGDGCGRLFFGHLSM